MRVTAWWLYCRSCRDVRHRVRLNLERRGLDETFDGDAVPQQERYGVLRVAGQHVCPGPITQRDRHRFLDESGVRDLDGVDRHAGLVVEAAAAHDLVIDEVVLRGVFHLDRDLAAWLGAHGDGFCPGALDGANELVLRW